MKRNVALGITLLALSACSDSVLYPQLADQNAPRPTQPAAPVPFANKPAAAPAPQANVTTVKESAPAMTLKVESPEAANILLPADEYAIDTTERAKISQLNVRLKMRSLEEVAASGENRVRLFAQISYRAADGRVHTREFVSLDTATLKRARNEDTMSGNLRDLLGSDLADLRIEARRKASDSLEQARSNAWTGSLTIRQGSQDLVLGRLSGVQVFSNGVTTK